MNAELVATSSAETNNLANHDHANDLWIGLRAFHVWGTLGWHDIRQRYRRSVLGPFWFTLSTAIMVAVMGALYAKLLHQEIHSYLPYLAVGIIIWQYLSTSMNEGCTAMMGSAYLIKQIRLPLTVHVCRIAWRNFIIFLHSFPAVLLLLLLLGYKPGITWLLLPFALFVLFLQGIWMGIVLGILCARYRDIPPIVSNFVQIAFFFTPVMWSADILKDRAWVAGFNPLYHLIEIIRAPLMGKPLYFESWLWALSLLMLGFGAAQFLLRRYRNRVPYWL